jgi:hypothetical protein
MKKVVLADAADRRRVGEHFECHVAIEDFVVRAVHDAHAPFANLRQDAIVPEQTPDDVFRQSSLPVRQ